MDNHLGSLVKQLRTEKNLSQEQLADIIECSRRHFLRIESGEVFPSRFLLKNLSDYFQVDFASYLQILTNFSSVENYNLYNKMRDAIGYSNIEEMEAIVSEYQNNYTTLDQSTQQMYHQCNALINVLKKRDWKTAENFCLESIKLDIADFSLENPMTDKYNNPTYLSLNSLASVLSYQGKKLEAKTLFKKLIDNLEKNFINCSYEIAYTVTITNVYISSLNNYATILVDENNFAKAMNLADKALDFSFKNDSLFLVGYLNFIKVEILYQNQEYTQAQDLYIKVITLLELLQDEYRKNTLINIAKKEYPLLLEK